LRQKRKIANTTSNTRLRQPKAQDSKKINPILKKKKRKKQTNKQTKRNKKALSVVGFMGQE